MSYVKHKGRRGERQEKENFKWRSLLPITPGIINESRGLGAETHLAGIVSIGFKVNPELGILLSHSIGRQKPDEGESYFQSRTDQCFYGQKPDHRKRRW